MVLLNEFHVLSQVEINELKVQVGLQYYRTST